MEKPRPPETSPQPAPGTYTNPEGYVVRVIPEVRAKRVAVGRGTIRVQKPRVKHSELTHLDNEFARNRKGGR